MNEAGRIFILDHLGNMPSRDAAIAWIKSSVGDEYRTDPEFKRKMWEVVKELPDGADSNP